MGIWLTMTTSDGRQRPFPLSGHRMVIGRDRRCDVQVPLPTVAPRHCEIAIEGALLTVRDLGTTTGTLRNGRRIEQAVLEPGDHVTVGLVTFVVNVNAAVPQPECTAEAQAEPSGRQAHADTLKTT